MALVWAVVIGLAAVALAIRNIWLRIAASGRRAAGCVTEATIVAHHDESMGRRPRSFLLYRGTIGIARYRDTEGREHTKYVGDHPIGAKLVVLFNPRRPDRAFEQPPRHPIVVITVSLAIAVLCALFVMTQG